MKSTVFRMTTRISKGGQISIPAAVRRRWKTDELIVEDFGSRLVVRPVPDDPIEAAFGAFPGKQGDAARAMAQLRREEADADRRRKR